MTYAALDTSIDRGAPFELYEFTMLEGSRSWKYCDSPEGYAGYASTQITRSNIVRDAEQIGSGLSITVAHDNPLALELLESLSSYPIKVLIKAGHMGDPDGQLLPIYRGMIAGVHFNGAQAEITCVSRYALSTQKKIPWITTQAGCNWELGGEGCGVNLTSFTSTVVLYPTDRSGTAMTVMAAGGRPDGYYSGGYLKRASGDGSTRFIRKHVGDQLLLDRPFSNMAASGESYLLVPGCKKTEGDCATRYSNLANYLGWSRLPSVNPFNRSAFYLSSTPSAPASSWELPPPYSGYSLVAKEKTIVSSSYKFDYCQLTIFVNPDGSYSCQVDDGAGVRSEGAAWASPTPLPLGSPELFDIMFDNPVILEGSSSVGFGFAFVAGGTPATSGESPAYGVWLQLTSMVTALVMVLDINHGHFRVKIGYKIRERSSGFWRAQSSIYFESSV